MPFDETTVVDRIDGVDVTKGELEAAFDRVADPDDWRAPIDATIRVENSREVAVILRAIMFFTATMGYSTPVNGVEPPEKPNFYRFVAKGYRAGPAGDH